jgi:hypothetical protein
MRQPVGWKIIANFALSLDQVQVLQQSIHTNNLLLLVRHGHR